VAASYRQRRPFDVNQRSFVAALTLDRLGHLQGDSVLVSGLRDLDSVVRADWIAAAHPELGLRVVDAALATVPEAEGGHLAWVRHNVPSLYVHGRGHGTGDVPATLDLDAAARTVRFIFYLGDELAMTNRQPRWSREGRQRYLALQPGP
jgi:hypothetical protein